jgi:N-formylglutamate deformylase
VSDWLDIHRGDAPLLASFPHTGTDIPAGMEQRFTSPWLARKDADWWIDRLYSFVRGMGVTTVRTRISRSVIDVNRDPTGQSLYPGQATTELCPTTTFDGEPLYASDAPDSAEIAQRRTLWFDPYHHALSTELDRLKAANGKVVLYDAHSILSHVPRLFEGVLPQFNIGTNGGATCDPALECAVAEAASATGRGHVVNGRFRGGWTTRHYGRPGEGYHAIQMELAMGGYLAEPETIAPDSWPVPFDPTSPLIDDLKPIIAKCLAFART